MGNQQAGMDSHPSIYFRLPSTPILALNSASDAILSSIKAERSECPLKLPHVHAHTAFIPNRKTLDGKERKSERASERKREEREVHWRAIAQRPNLDQPQTWSRKEGRNPEVKGQGWEHVGFIGQFQGNFFDYTSPKSIAKMQSIKGRS